MFEAYIWDFDGTLYDTYPIMLDAFVKTLKEYGINAERIEIYQILKSTSSLKVAEKYQLDFNEFTANFKTHELQDQRIPTSYQGTKEMLQHVVTAGKQNYIYTHRTTDSTIELLKREGLLELFVEVIGSDHPSFTRKPYPETIEYLVAKYQLNPMKTAMIGDRTIDIDAGINAQVQTIFYDLEKLLDGSQADFTVNSVEEMWQLID